MFQACSYSFLAVFILLGVLAVLFRLITALFPAGAKTDDAPVVAAIHTAVAVTFPEARVSRIEEIRK